MAESQLTSKLTIRVPVELHRRLKIVLAYDGRSAQEVLEAMLETWVSKKERERDA